MLELGLAVYYRPSHASATAKEYEHIQSEAKKSKIGIWSDPNFELPIDFRRKKNAEKQNN